jgi:phage baseplate assembly protein W
MLLLLTKKGERYYEPDYGTDLEKFIFEPNDGITSSDIIDDIKNTVALYLPNISIKNVTFTRSDTDPTLEENQITVGIDFIYTEDSFSQKDTLELKF